MSCPETKKLCKHLIISTGVFNVGGTLVITLPDGIYADQEKYCIVIAQNIPDTLTVTSPVAIRIGTGTTNYSLVNCDGSPVYACSMNTRTRYSTKVVTTPTSGTFRLLGKLPCSRCVNNLPYIPPAT